MTQLQEREDTRRDQDKQEIMKEIRNPKLNPLNLMELGKQLPHHSHFEKVMKKNH